MYLSAFVEIYKYIYTYIYQKTNQKNFGDLKGLIIEVGGLTRFHYGCKREDRVSHAISIYRFVVLTLEYWPWGEICPCLWVFFLVPVNLEWTAGQQSTWLNYGWTLAAIQAAGISSLTCAGEGEIWIKAPYSFSSYNTTLEFSQRVWAKGLRTWRSLVIYIPSSVEGVKTFWRPHRMNLILPQVGSCLPFQELLLRCVNNPACEGPEASCWK